uniref:Uncharacterized protein n=1 Tax=Aegilops tauschii subsp. strangulata TaxID=200361 RepID=A0A453KJT9_AEGTS
SKDTNTPATPPLSRDVFTGYSGHSLRSLGALPSPAGRNSLPDVSIPLCLSPPPRLANPSETPRRSRPVLAQRRDGSRAPPRAGHEAMR